MTVLRCENLSDVRQQETEAETNQDIEQVIPATTAISCHFLLFRFRQRLAFADDFNERPGCSRGSSCVVELLRRYTGHDLRQQPVRFAAFTEPRGRASRAAVEV